MNRKHFSTQNRITVFAVVAMLVALPAAALHVLCLGRACDSAAGSGNRTPFCSLPSDVRSAIANGFYEKRSGDIIAISDGPVTGGPTTDGKAPLWPSVSTAPPRAGVVLSGQGVEPGISLPAMGLDDIAPTVADLIDLDRPHPEVRSGRSLEGIASPPIEAPRLILEVVWKGVSADDLEKALGDLPNVAALVEGGASTFRAATESLPHDEAALITTIGTGGVPRQHGITGSILRNDAGLPVTAWDEGSPVNVIATLGDHLDELNRNKAVIGGVGTAPFDRGVVGGRWYPGGDVDRFSIVDASPREQASAAVDLLRKQPFGRDQTVDLFGFVQEGPVAELDEELGRVIAQADSRSDGSLLVALTAIGPPSGPEDGLSATTITRRLERSIQGPDLLEAVGLGGFYLDQQVLVRRKLSDDVILRSLLELEHQGRRIFADVFPAIAITFGRYCDG